MDSTDQHRVLYSVNSINQQPGGQFVLSNGDATGYSFHGDFINGWDQDILEDAVQNCLYSNGDGVVASCGVLKPSNDLNFARTCPQAADAVSEQIRGRLASLPGCNPVTPADASRIPACAASAKVPTPGSTSNLATTRPLTTSMSGITTIAIQSLTTKFTVSTVSATTLSNAAGQTLLSSRPTITASSTAGPGQQFFTVIRSGRISSPTATTTSIYPQSEQNFNPPDFVAPFARPSPADYDREDRVHGWQSLNKSSRTKQRRTRQARWFKANQG